MKDFLSSTAGTDPEPIDAASATRATNEVNRQHLRDSLDSHRRAVATNDAVVDKRNAQITATKAELAAVTGAGTEDDGASIRQQLRQRITEYELNRENALHQSELIKPEITELEQALR